MLTLKQVQERYEKLKREGKISYNNGFYAKYGEQGYCEHNFAGETWVRTELNGKFQKR